MSDGEADIKLLKIQAIEKRVFANLNGVLEQMKSMEKQMYALAEENRRLTGNVANQQNQLQELRRQLGLLQQQFYAKGTTSYGDNSGLGNQGSERPTG